MSEEQKFRKLKGSFQYELLLAIRDARKLYIESREHPELSPTFYDSVIAIYDMIMPFLKEEDKNKLDLHPKIKVNKDNAEHIVINKYLQHMIRREAHKLFRRAIELCAKEKLIVTEISDEF